MSEWWGPPWPGHGEGGRGGEHLPPRGGHLRCARQERRQEHRAPLQVLTLTVCQRQRQRHTESVLLTSQLKLHRGKRQLCPKVSTKLLSRQQLWQLRSTIVQIYRQGKLVSPGKTNIVTPWKIVTTGKIVLLRVLRLGQILLRQGK